MTACSHQWVEDPNERGCGCEFQHCARCGAWQKLQRCYAHRAAGDRGGADYYRTPGMAMWHEDGITPRNRPVHIEALRALTRIEPAAHVLEIGAGVGRLVPLFLRAGCQYAAVEPDRWAARYIRQAYGVPVVCRTLETAHLDEARGAVVAVHALEHFHAADAAFERMVALVAPGNWLLIVVPDGSDRWNPDHWWGLSTITLSNWGAALGLELLYMRTDPGTPEAVVTATWRKPA